MRMIPMGKAQHRTLCAAAVKASLVAALLVAQPAQAELDLGFEVGAGRSDNIRRAAAGETSETIGVVGFDMAWSEQTRRLLVDAAADLSYFEYLDDAFESEVVGTANGALTVGVIPERLTWLIQDSFGQAQTDPFAIVTPATREDLNYFTTGPDFLQRLGGNTLLRLFGRYSSAEYEVSPLDAERNAAGVSVARFPSARSELALNGVAEQIDFEAVDAADYDRDSVYLSYDLDAARTDLNARLGYIWLEPDDGERSGGLLADLNVIREVSAHSTLELQLGVQFTDAAEALRMGLDRNVVGGVDISASTDPFEDRSASLRWSFRRNRTGFFLGAGWNEERYERQRNLDRVRFAYEAGVSRRLSSAVDVAVLATLDDEEFDNADVQFDELGLAARLNWRAGRTIGLQLSVERFDRDSSDGATQYVENRAFLLITYRPISSTTSDMRALP